MAGVSSRVFVSIIALAAAVGFSPGARGADVLVFAASSTTNAIEEVNALFNRAGPRRAVAAFGSSGMLARQIENGAPAHILVSANRPWIDYLVKRRLLADRARAVLFTNRLALIAPAGSALDIEIAPGFPLARKLGDGWLAIADPGHTPAGSYAKAALVSLGVWSKVARRTARGLNVREALARVERGEAAAGIVYRTDAMLTAKVRLVALFPADLHPPIFYEAARIAGRDTPAARRYFAFLTSPTAKTVFRRFGFSVDGVD